MTTCEVDIKFKAINPLWYEHSFRYGSPPVAAVTAQNVYRTKQIMKVYVEPSRNIYTGRPTGLGSRNILYKWLGGTKHVREGML